MRDIRVPLYFVYGPLWATFAGFGHPWWGIVVGSVVVFTYALVQAWWDSRKPPSLFDC